MLLESGSMLPCEFWCHGLLCVLVLEADDDKGRMRLYSALSSERFLVMSLGG